DYLDMLLILKVYPKIKLRFNLVPSLLEQIKDYLNPPAIKERFLELSLKPASSLNLEEKKFIRQHFFMINPEKVISRFPRYYELYLKNLHNFEFSLQDYLDLQVLFNLAWIDPYFRKQEPLKSLVAKARFFTEEEKFLVLEKQRQIISEIIPTYKKFFEAGQIEITTTPFYHPILPLVYNTKIALEANPKVNLPKLNFSYPEDSLAQIKEGVEFIERELNIKIQGMWPSEEAVSDHILEYFIEAGINWIITDEAILFKSLKKNKRDTELLYQAHFVKRKDKTLNLIFRDRNLSDLISFVYHGISAKEAVDNFLGHLKNINLAFKDKNPFVVVALDGENAWEYYEEDGWQFLSLLYERLSESDFIKTTTPSEYLRLNPPQSQIKRLSSGSWIFGNLFKWIGSPKKNLAWEYLARARKELEDIKPRPHPNKDLLFKQIYILEGSDWFWWYDEQNPFFDELFRLHLRNFYTLLGKQPPIPFTSPL
ncbi:MAG: glycoside hydrolase family 57 protein, partial [Candidatus Omnitrophica bacterium]|nr:glycoside hydrolase family 57 protein [Candidatus Omnitrophota bacterium]